MLGKKTGASGILSLSEKNKELNKMIMQFYFIVYFHLYFLYTVFHRNELVIVTLLLYICSGIEI